mmetsp:Transcript_34416/g.41582  ORF Transcript_34416/g.41582 Transcript_34416/m.41582 type:complete len:422 (+) Transcript_34416:284-1549(+)|eukprot:CAMPEP_0197866518 /NCGR_PEP_ID=MMETSP1438-20131217/44256_1 /TAXON_ID=1461541 /ORGANISM="Pterosperma sp., Strain CCMP1384" /LENGTH=421 /DNA_ID=CAMNT_0043485089 /DNA_START=775 /DNA_END=2040 /DNA_ORIENTATION=-
MEETTLKRSYDDGRQGGKRSRTDQRQLIITVPGACVSTLIGKGGQEIKAIEASSGARVSFAQSDETLSGEQVRRVTITASDMESNTNAQKFISTRVASIVSQLQPEEITKITLKMLVPNSYVSELIGKRGAAIKQVTESSGAYVSFHKDNEMPYGYQERMLKIEGDPDQVAAAQQMMSEKVYNLSIDTRTFRDTSVTSGYPDMSQMSQMSQFQPGGFQTGAYNTGSGTGASTQGLQHQLPTSLDPSWSMQGLQGMADLSGAAGLSALNSQLYSSMGMPQPPTGAASASSLQLGQMTLDRQGKMSQKIKSTLYVPHQMVGLVIGAKGAAIRDVIEQCANQVYISVAKEDKNTQLSFVSNEMMRPVSIDGPAEYVFKAQHLIQSKMHDTSKEGKPINWVLVATEENVTVHNDGQGRFQGNMAV